MKIFSSLRGVRTLTVVLCLLAFLVVGLSFVPEDVKAAWREQLYVGELYLSGTQVTATATELNQLDGDSTNSMQTLTKTVELTNADIKALAATPKELVAAPGADKVIEFVSLVLVLDYGSEVLAEPSAPDDLAVEYDDGTGTQIATWDTTGFITASADTMELVNSADIAAVATATNANKNLVLINTGGEYTGNASNDSTVTAIVSYRVHTLGL
jgi:hypothetical protein